RNAVNNAYKAPTLAGTTANCSLATLTVPGGGTAGAVGLSASDTWATDNPGVKHSDITFQGSAYPVCQLTFALVYTGLGGGGKAVARLSADQRATVRAFFTYSLSSLGQQRLAGASFTPLPTSFVDQFRAGFASNF